jgi:flagella basal body P-ring formation protein FlgA
MTIRLLNLWLAAAVVLGCVPALGANILLRQRSTHTGSIVYLGDVADISTGTDAEMHELATTPLMAAPAKGTQQFLHATQVRDLLSSRGIDAAEITIAGAKSIEIGKAAKVRDLVAVEPVSTATPEEVEEAVVEAIREHLISATGHSEWTITVDLNAAKLTELRKLGTELEASAGRNPWTGPQRFQMAPLGLTKGIALEARVERQQYVVVATRKIDAGNLIGVADVEVRLQEGKFPTSALGSLEQAIGKEALRSIEADAVLQSNQVRAPLQVQRGETVKVVARAGGITVSTFATVQQDGALGDLVQVQSLDKKDRFAARVSGWKELEVFPTGASAGDYATAKRPTSQTR